MNDAIVGALLKSFAHISVDCVFLFYEFCLFILFSLFL